MSKKSKDKGANFELKVSKLLTDWWGNGNFSRVPASGGLHWDRDQRVAGDIVPPPQSGFPFVTECKKQEGWELAHLFKNIGKPKEWWSQVVSDARRVQLVPILIFSKNRDEIFVLLPYSFEFYHELKEKYPVSRQSVSFENIREETEWFDTLLTTYTALSSYDPEYIKELYDDMDWDNEEE